MVTITCKYNKSQTHIIPMSMIFVNTCSEVHLYIEVNRPHLWNPHPKDPIHIRAQIESSSGGLRRLHQDDKMQRWLSYTQGHKGLGMMVVNHNSIISKIIHQY